MDECEAWVIALGSLPEVLGPADLPKLNEGLRYLFKELREAQAVYIGGSHLDGVYSSLVAVHAFLALFSSVGEKGLFVPLSELESALWALGEGVTEPLLRPVSRRAGRPKASQLRQEFVGMVAFTVQQLRDLGYSVPEAHQAVADELNSVGAKPDRGSDRFAARTIRDWCERVSEDVGRRLPAAQRYAQLAADPRTAAVHRMPREAAVPLLRGLLRRSAVLLGIAPRQENPPNPA